MAAEAVPMDRIHPYRPRVSRETRLLLTTALIAIAALWVLARVRFPDRPPPQNPVQPLLTQLTPRPTFADLASEIGALRPRLESLLVTGPARLPGLRVRDDVAAVWLDPEQQRRGSARLAASPRPRLRPLARADRTAVRAGAGALVAGGRWAALLHRARDVGRRLVASTRLRRPCCSPSTVRDGRDRSGSSRANANIAPGSFLFTADAAVAGLVVDYGEGRALVPAATVLAEASRLIDRPPAVRGYVGIDVQPLTSSLVKATGATGGLIVTWVDPGGPAAGALNAGDVIETANGAAMATVDHWDVQIARLGAGQTLIIGVYAAGGTRGVSVVASAAACDGSRIARADAAGRAGDRRRSDSHRARFLRRSGRPSCRRVVTRVNSTAAPTPAQVRQAFGAARERPLIVAFTRGRAAR